MSKKYYFFILLLTPVLSSCLYDVVENFEIEREKFHVKNIITSKNHLAFPDLIYYDSIWYVAYRESDAHVNGTYSKIKVVRSPDFINWTDCNTFEIKGYDLRDPKFSYNNKTDSLYLHFHKTNERGALSSNYGTYRSNIFVGFKKGQGVFGGNTRESKLPADYKNYWLWKPYWHNNILYVAGYRTGTLIFLKYDNVNREPIIFSKIQGELINETALNVYDNNLYAISRRGKDALFSKLSVSMDSLYEVKESVDIFVESTPLPIAQLGGPNMIIKNGIAYIGGRIYDNTVFYKYRINENKIEYILTLPSYGDNSYPGMLLRNDTIYGVYYTENNQRDGFEINSFIIHID